MKLNFLDPVQTLQGPFLLLMFTVLQNYSFSNQSNWPRFEARKKKSKFLSTFFFLPSRKKTKTKKQKNPHSLGLSTMAVTCTLGFLRMVFRGNRDGSSPFRSSQGSPKHTEVSFQFCAAFYFFL